MSIKMQGLWLVKVKSKSASFAQQFKIEGASVGNGVYTGDVTTPEVFVTGSNWSITILNNPGTGFIPSEMQIKFPVSSGGFYAFDVQSNDAGGDEDFDDLVLTCRTPAGSNDYVIYGNVNYYAGVCFNPCFRRSIVIDSAATLREALKNESLSQLIGAYYPNRVNQLKTRANFVALNPQPLPPSPGDPFRPMIIPLNGDAPIPAPAKNIVRSKTETLSPDAKQKSGEPVVINRLISSERIPATASASQQPVSAKLSLAATSIADRFRLNCESGILQSAILNIQQYDRSAAELSGGPYTGDGSRYFEGQTITDRNGNYIFKFTMTASQTVSEILNDTASGENASIQAAPDILIQLVCLGSLIPAFETAPAWNIQHLQRIDVCVPKEHSCLIPFACDGQHILQGVGNIVLGPPGVGGERTGSGNYLNSLGLITAFSSLGPAARCSAWYGTLLLRGCLKNSAVKYYRLSYRTNTIFSSFTPFTQPFSLPRFIGPNVVESPVFDTTRNAYLNVENDPGGNWLLAYRNIKAQIAAGAFANGSYIFRIEGLDASLHSVAGTEETLVLYIDNGHVQSDIDDEITMDGSGTLGECALFTLPESAGATVENPGITVKFRAIHNPGTGTGFMNSYGLSMLKGSGGFSFTPGAAAANFISPPFLDNVVNSGRNYVHADNLNCVTYFQGTVNEVSADADGYYAVTLKPASGGWLDPGQKFCAFAISLTHQLRLTDGQSLYPGITTNTVLIGIQRP